MALLHSCLVARLRHPAEGEPGHVTLAEANNISGEGTASARVVAAYHELMGSSPEAIEDRRKYSHVVLIVDNGMRANHEFPDLDAAAAKKKQVEATRAAAERQRQAEKKAAALREQLAAAEAEEAAAKSRLANLTGKPVEPTEPKEDPGTLDADPQGGTPANVAPTGSNQEESGASAPSGAGNLSEKDSDATAVEKMAARFEAGESPTAAELGELSETQLRDLAKIYEFEIPEGIDKAGIVALFLGADDED